MASSSGTGHDTALFTQTPPCECCGTIPCQHPAADTLRRALCGGTTLDEAHEALDAFLAERQQDKERIERLEKALELALDCLELSLARLDTVEPPSSEHLRIRAAGLTKARAVLADEEETK